MRMFLSLLFVAALLMPAFTLADDAGVLTEGELNAWLVSVLANSREEVPQNSPMSEDALTEDGYAFLYSFATLYYDKPVLDAKSVLTGLSVTDEQLETPRGIRIGSPQAALVEAYGWQNPTLIGDDSFAALYMLDTLPQAAYWAWAQREGGQMSTVQCAIHARTADGRYTDAGVRYELENGVVMGIRVYGLNQTIAPEDVDSNLAAVQEVQAAGSGETAGSAMPAQGNYVKNEATAFDVRDLKFGHIDFANLNEEAATAAFGPADSERWEEDGETGLFSLLTLREGITLLYAADESKQNARLETLSFTKEGLEGPRGVQVGDALDSVLGKFRSDGTGETYENWAVLYEDGPQMGMLETFEGGARLRYITLWEGQDGITRTLTLDFIFQGSVLVETAIYTR